VQFKKRALAAAAIGAAERASFPDPSPASIIATPRSTGSQISTRAKTRSCRSCARPMATAQAFENAAGGCFFLAAAGRFGHS
jgi:hypothetical protein